LVFRARGGKRRGAGRKPNGPRAGVSHLRRPKLARRFPVHVTLRLRPDISPLRTRFLYPIVRRALCATCDRGTFRIVQFSVMDDHIHMLVEASDETALARGMQSFSIRLAQGINRRMQRTGRVLADRYHAVILRSPRQVRHALCYVLQNAKRHAGQLGEVERLDPSWLDPCSSAAYFDGWSASSRHAIPPPARPPPVAAPGTWLLAVGWRRHGAIDLAEVPGPRR
jgi:REP element-mobilizing transposase RayT